ncbi:hypothetical protein KUCAC02_016417, partial [Chaenocephalus aceratus]
MEPVLKDIKTKYPQVTTVHFWSDGPSKQYKNKKNFFLLSAIPPTLGFEKATWNFFPTSHEWGSDMASLLVLLHLLTPQPAGRKRAKKISVREAIDHLVIFHKSCKSLEDHLMTIEGTHQPYLLATGTSKAQEMENEMGGEMEEDVEMEDVMEELDEEPLKGPEGTVTVTTVSSLNNGD